MLKLLNHDRVVPENGDGQNFRYRHRETAHWSVATDYYTWLDRIRLHRRSNNLNPITPAAAEDQLCRTLPPGWCKHSSLDAPPAVSTRFAWADVVEGMKAFAKLVWHGFVPQAEADRRANICSACYFNVGVQGCGTCHKMAMLVTGDVARKSSEFDSNLKACAVCKCSLKALVHFELDALNNSPQKQALFPEFCWQKVGGENYRGVDKSLSRQAHNLEIAGSTPAAATQE